MFEHACLKYPQILNFAFISSDCFSPTAVKEQIENEEEQEVKKKKTSGGGQTIDPFVHSTVSFACIKHTAIVLVGRSRLSVELPLPRQERSWSLFHMQSKEEPPF